jgi:hypothetical protein
VSLIIRRSRGADERVIPSSMPASSYRSASALSRFGLDDLAPPFAPFFFRTFVGLIYRIRGGGPTLPGIEYESETIPLAGSVRWSREKK